MKIEKLKLHNFRNYSDLTFDFDGGTNVLYGKNGQGKTNIIEALYFFCNGRSYRVSKDFETVKEGEKEGELYLNFEAEKRKMRAEIKIEKNKMIKLNGVPVKKLSQLVGVLKAVLFTPDYLELIKDGPSKRRTFLDGFISQIYPVYFKNLAAYYKILKQKNACLKERKANDDMIDIWNESLAAYGSVICRYRCEMIEKINPYAEKYQGEMSNGTEKLSLLYSPSVKEKFYDKEYFYKVLSQNKEREKEMGFSLIGPSRDDFDFKINGRNMKIFGSQGQMRTALLALILSQCELINDIFGEYPVLLLDDILSELDEQRRRYMLSEIKNKQVILTCTDKEEFEESSARFFEIKR